MQKFSSCFKIIREFDIQIKVGCQHANGCGFHKYNHNSSIQKRNEIILQKKKKEIGRNIILFLCHLFTNLVWNWDSFFIPFKTSLLTKFRGNVVTWSFGVVFFLFYFITSLKSETDGCRNGR